MKPFIYLIFFISFLSASKLIEIDLSNQKIYAKENGEVVFSGNISSGKRGYFTPRGNYKIIEKDRYHVSNKYPKPNGGAKMHYMLRLTNYGLAIHQGYLPGYPASHGCIRVGKKTAIKLWRWAKIGTKVKIYGDTQYYLTKIYKKKSLKKYSKKRKKYYTKKRKYKKRRAYSKKSIKKQYSKKRYVKRVRPVYEVIELYDDY